MKQKTILDPAGTTVLGLAVVMVLFFLTGFTTAFNSILNPFFQTKLNLNYTSIVMIQIAFYFAYFICSPLAGVWFKNNYVAGIRTGLVIGAIGMLTMGIAALVDSFELVLISIFIQGSAIALTQVTANPYIFELGDATSAPSRFLFAQAFISLGMVTAPYIGSTWILSTLEMENTELNTPLFSPYIILSTLWFFLFVITAVYAMPKNKRDLALIERHSVPPLKDKQVLFGMLAIGLCVGVETTIASFMIKFLADPSITGFPLVLAGKLTILFWIGFMLGRFLGSWLLRFMPQEKLLAFHGLLGAFFASLSMITSGYTAAASIILLGFCISNLFPLVFSMVLSKTRSCKTKASGYLCMANIGGAIIPLTQGKVADFIGLKSSFCIPVLCFLFFIGYAWAQQLTTQEDKAYP